MPSSTGEKQRTDTTKVTVPISFIRDANAKLIEREYLIKINKEQDSIINLGKLFSNEQTNIIKNFQSKIVDLTTANNSLIVSNNKLKKTTKTLATVIGAALVTAIGIIFIK